MECTALPIEAWVGLGVLVSTIGFFMYLLYQQERHYFSWLKQQAKQTRERVGPSEVE